MIDDPLVKTLLTSVVEDESNGNNALKISFKLKDVDNTISEPKICIKIRKHNGLLTPGNLKNKK